MPYKDLEKQRESERKYGRMHKTKRNDYNKKYKLKFRTEILALLGNKCVCCGFSDPRALQIDHVNGHGSQERKLFKRDSARFYKFVLKQIKSGSKDYQLLCANCNWIKRIEKKEN